MRRIIESNAANVTGLAECKLDLVYPLRLKDAIAALLHTIGDHAGVADPAVLFFLMRAVTKVA